MQIISVCCILFSLKMLTHHYCLFIIIYKSQPMKWLICLSLEVNRNYEIIESNWFRCAVDANDNDSNVTHLCNGKVLHKCAHKAQKLDTIYTNNESNSTDLFKKPFSVEAHAFDTVFTRFALCYIVINHHKFNQWRDFYSSYHCK